MKINEGVPPLVKQNEDNDAPESSERRDALQAGLRAALGFYAFMKGLGTDDAEARGRKRRRTPPLLERKRESKKEKPSLPEQYQGAEGKEFARKEYENSLTGILLGLEHRRQGDEIKVSDLMEPPLTGLHEPTQEQLRAMLGEQNGLVVIPSFHRALLYTYNSDTYEFTLTKEMPVSTGRHKDATEGEYFSPRGFFKARWKKELHLSKYSTAFKQMQELPRRLWKTIKEEAYDMHKTVNLNEDGVATHASSRFSKNKKGEETVILDRSHGCINMRNEDATLVYNTLSDIQTSGSDAASTVVILSDVKNIKNRQLADVMKEEFAEDTQEYTQVLRKAFSSAQGEALDQLIQKQPDIADYIAQIRRYGDIDLADKNSVEGMVRAPLQRDPDSNELVYANGVKVGQRALLFAKDGALRPYELPETVGGKKIEFQGHEAEAPQLRIEQKIIEAEKEGRIHGAQALVASRGFETGVDIGNETYVRGLSTFLIDPEVSPEFKKRIADAVLQKGNRQKLLQSINAGEVLVGVLRPDEFSAFVDKHSIDRGEPVYVNSNAIPNREGGFDTENKETFLAGLVLDVLPLPDAHNNFVTDEDGQWGMVLISKPSATVRAIDK